MLSHTGPSIPGWQSRVVKEQDRRKLTLAQGFPDGASAKEPTCQCRKHKRSLGLILGSRRSPGRGHGKPLQYSCLENSMDRGAWWAPVHRVAQSWTRLKWLSVSLLLTLWDRATVLVHIWYVISKSFSAVLRYRFIAHSWFFELAGAVLFGFNPWTWSRFATNVLTHWFPLCVGVWPDWMAPFLTTSSFQNKWFSTLQLLCFRPWIRFSFALCLILIPRLQGDWKRSGQWLLPIAAVGSSLPFSQLQTQHLKPPSEIPASGDAASSSAVSAPQRPWSKYPNYNDWNNPNCFPWFHQL